MIDLDLSKIKKVYFIGIGGIGISALAQFALSRGMEVGGVNDEDSPATLLPLSEKGVKITFKNEFKELPEADMYVYSDAWIHRGPEILELAKKSGKPTLSYFETLGIFAKDYKVIAISGVHGKTTTTAMIADVLIEVGIDPTVVVGSFVKKFGSNFKKGKSEWLVVEADEYMRHFLNLKPEILVITNIEPDHLDYYKDLADIEDAFSELIRQTKSVVICDPKDISVLKVINAKNIRIIDYSKFINLLPKLSIPGEHNRKNAACALGVAIELELDLEKAKEALQKFSGTWRRLEKRGVTGAGTIIYDDYAHHPTEIKASLEALLELYKMGEKKITVVFQPHLYSRTKAFFNDFAKCFKGADRVILLPIYFARENPDPTISSGKLAEAICLAGERAIAFTDFELAENFLKSENFGKDDILVTMGAGEAYKVADKVFKFN